MVLRRQERVTGRYWAMATAEVLERVEVFFRQEWQDNVEGVNDCTLTTLLMLLFTLLELLSAPEGVVPGQVVVTVRLAASRFLTRA